MNKAQTVFLFPRGIKMQLGDALAMNYAASFKGIQKSSTLETRVLSIFSEYTTFLVESIHLVERSRGRLSRDRPIMVSDDSPVLYIWTGQGRQAFEVHLSPEEYGRATCRSPEDVNTVSSIVPLIPEEPEGIKGSEVLNPEMIRCLLAFKQGLQSPRQISVTVARCQEMVAAHGGHSINHYEQWFVRSGVVVQPYTRANIVRVHVDHGRLEGLLTEAGYSFNDQGYRVSQIVVENEVTTTESCPTEVVPSAQKAVKTTECTGDLQDKNQEFQSNIQIDQSFVNCEELKDPLRSLLPTNLDRDQQIDWLADFIDQLVKKR